MGKSVEQQSKGVCLRTQYREIGKEKKRSKKKKLSTQQVSNPGPLDHDACKGQLLSGSRHSRGQIKLTKIPGSPPEQEFFTIKFCVNCSMQRKINSF